MLTLDKHEESGGGGSNRERNVGRGREVQIERQTDNRQGDGRERETERHIMRPTDREEVRERERVLRNHAIFSVKSSGDCQS